MFFICSSYAKAMLKLCSSYARSMLVHMDNEIENEIEIENRIIIKNIKL